MKNKKRGRQLLKSESLRRLSHSICLRNEDWDNIMKVSDSLGLSPSKYLNLLHKKYFKKKFSNKNV